MVEQLEQRRGDPFRTISRWPTASAVAEELAQGAPTGPGLSQPKKQELTPEKQIEEESYTSRLLKAKQRVWDERKDKEKDKDS